MLSLGFGRVAAISLDLDDTLWPILPTLQRAEACLHAWLAQYFPEVAQRYTPEQMRLLRDQVAASHPELQHDFTAVRLISLRRAMFPCGANEADVQDAFEVLFAARNQVELFPEVQLYLEKLAACVPLISISNGNADLHRIGIAHFFRASVNARGVGCAKPDARIFQSAAAQLDIAPNAILHIGDHLEQDVFGAKRVGMFAGWISADESTQAIAEDHLRPDLYGANFASLCAQLL